MLKPAKPKDFDKALVQHKILDAHPRKTNLRKRIVVGKEPRIIHACYWHNGEIVPDTGFTPDFSKSKTSPRSRLSEIFTTRRTGPTIEPFSSNHPSKLVREGFYSLEYARTNGEFRREFYKICKGLGFNVMLFHEGFDHFVCSKREISYKSDIGIKKAVRPVKVRLDMDLEKTDPTLSNVLTAIEEAYDRIRNGDPLETARLYL